MKGAKTEAKQRAKRRLIAMKISLVFAVSGFLILTLSSTILKDWIIIGYGVRFLGKVQLVGQCLSFMSSACVIIYGIPVIKAAREQKKELEQKMRSVQNRSRVLADYAKDSTNPDLTRRRLQQLQDEIPALEDLVMQCLEQMDAMDALQEKQNALIEANDARYLKDTINVLDNVERRICQNFRNVINLCIAADSAESLDEKKVNKYLKDNRKKLSNTKELLKASADWINQYNADEDSDRSEVENWIAVIRDSLRGE